MRSIQARAALAVGLLVGIYLLALLVIAGTIGLLWLAIKDPNAATFRITLIALLAAAAVLRGLWAGLRSAHGDGPSGEALTREAQPALWSSVHELAAAVGTRPPDEIRLIPVVNAAVVEESSWLGLKAGTRRMYIGLPLMQAMNVSELRSVLAHELGHYSERHTALGPVVFRGRVALINLLRHVGQHRIVGRLFYGYGKLYFRVTLKVSRDQEYEADAAAARIAGRDSTIAALGRLPATTAAWKYFLNRYVGPSAQASLTPSALFDGFSSLLANPQRQEELDAIQPDAKAKPDPYDSHPPLAQRIEALRRLPADQRPTDTASSLTLLADRATVQAALPQHLLAKPATPATWDQIAEQVARSNAQSVTSRLLRAAASCGPEFGPNLHGVLAVIEAGHGDVLATRIDPKSPVKQRTQLVGWAMQNLVACALSDGGRLHWTVSWAGSPWRMESALDISTIPGLTSSAITDPTATTKLRRQLKKLGVPEDYTVPK